jgi:hypothetical protein
MHGIPSFSLIILPSFASATPSVFPSAFFFKNLFSPVAEPVAEASAFTVSSWEALAMLQSFFFYQEEQELTVMMPARLWSV